MTTIKGATFDAVARALSIIAGVRADDPRIRGWIHHNDERVPLALLSDRLAPVLAASPEYTLLLYARAQRDAQRDEVAWNPLFDRLAQMGVWPLESGTIVLAGQSQSVAPRSPEELLEPVLRWLADLDDPALTREVREGFSAPQLRALPRRRAGATALVPDEPAAAAVVADDRTVEPGVRTGDAVSAVFAALQADARHPSLTVAMDVATAASEAAAATDHASAPAGAVAVAEPISEAVAALITPGRALEPAEVGTLLVFADLATGRTDERAVHPDARAAINALLACDLLATEALHRLYGACRRIKQWVVRIVTHASSTIELWRNALRDNNWIEVREAICRNRAARKDAVIRRILSRSASATVLCALCLDGDSDDIVQLVRRLATLDPWGLLQALREALRTTGLRLAAGDLSPLLSSSDQAVQAETIRLLQSLVRPA